MGRSGPRLLKPAAVLVVLLLAGPASAERLADDPDDRGDVTSQPGVEVDEPSVDLVTFTADRDGDTLVLRNEVAGALPLPGTAEPDGTRLYTFLFVVDFQSGMDRPLIQSADVVVVCTFHHGASDLECRQEQGDRTLRGVGTHDRNATVRIALEPGEAVQPLLVGGAATLKDEETDDILAQDWTPATIGGQDADDDGQEADGGDGGVGGGEGAPWTRRPVTAVAVALALLGLSFFAYRRFRDRP